MVGAVRGHTGRPVKAILAAVLDLTPAFAGIDPSSLWVSPGDAHPNARGHAIIGDYLLHETIDARGFQKQHRIRIAKRRQVAE